DPVGVHVAETLLAIPAARARLIVGDAEPLELLEAAARRRDEADRVRSADRELPRVAALVVLHELRGVLGVLLGEVLLPDVRWLEDVDVGGDDLVLLATHR